MIKMIKIDDSVIMRIQENHLTAAKEIIKDSIKKFKYDRSDKSYILKNKKGVHIGKFDSKYKNIIEKLLGARIEHHKESVNIKFVDSYKNVKLIILGDLDKTIDNFLKLYQEEYDVKIKSILETKYEMIQLVSRINIPNINKKEKDEINQNRKNDIDIFISLYKEYIDDRFIEKYKDLQDNGFSKMVTNKGEFVKNFKMKKNNMKIIENYKEKNKVLKYIFDYNRLCDGIEIKDNIIWDRHELISKMEFRTCPYCNRQYITNYIDESKENKTTADLDHYYSKSDYPFLALSLYNFIPSCQICNSRFKIAKDFYFEPHIYPYKDEFGKNAKFITGFYTNSDIERNENKKKITENERYDINYLLGTSENFKIEIEISSNDSRVDKKIQNSINTFHLKELYNLHKDYIRELIKKAIIYNESRIDELYTQYPKLFNSREEVLQMVVSNYINDDDLEKRPLAKLTKDICEELGLR